MYWPYDEIQIRGDASDKTVFHLQSPWLSFRFKVTAPDNSLFQQSIEKLSSGNVDKEDIEIINRVFASLSNYPVAYILPRNNSIGIDSHKLTGQPLNLNSPHELFSEIFSGENLSFMKTNLNNNWTWDVDQALEFCKTTNGYDPLSLFTVLRRFHLLNDLESNQTAALFEYIKSLSKDTDQFKKASALVLRQNHYVTVRCEEVLSAAIKISQSADAKIQEFIQAESGHDRIISKAISSLGLKAEDTPVIEASIVLMDLFKLIGQKNLLAFSAVVDVFERTSYRNEDPLTTVLKSGGLDEAGKMVDIHREINDEGDHENVALEFLEDMKPVSEDYAREALRLAELNTMVINQHSKELLRTLQS